MVRVIGQISGWQEMATWLLTDSEGTSYLPVPRALSAQWHDNTVDSCRKSHQVSANISTALGLVLDMLLLFEGK